MRIEQIITSEGTVRLKAADVLACLPQGVTLYDKSHNLRHPLGVYNTSIQNIGDRLGRTVATVTDQASLSSFLAKSDNRWEEQILELSLSARAGHGPSRSEFGGGSDRCLERSLMPGVWGQRLKSQQNY